MSPKDINTSVDSVNSPSQTAVVPSLLPHDNNASNNSNNNINNTNTTDNSSSSTNDSTDNASAQTLNPENFTYEEISQYFHLPISQAAHELKVCETVLKKICRTNGIKRWPHRKIRSIDTMMNLLEFQKEQTTNEVEIKRMQKEIDDLKQKKIFFLASPNTNFQSIIPKSTLQSFSKTKLKNQKSFNAFLSKKSDSENDYSDSDHHHHPKRESNDMNDVVNNTHSVSSKSIINDENQNNNNNNQTKKIDRESAVELKNKLFPLMKDERNSVTRPNSELEESDGAEVLLLLSLSKNQNSDDDADDEDDNENEDYNNNNNNNVEEDDENNQLYKLSWNNLLNPSNQTDTLKSEERKKYSHTRKEFNVLRRSLERCIFSNSQFTPNKYAKLC